MPRRRGNRNKIRLNEPDDLRRFIVRVINDLNEGLISESQAKTYGYLANTLTKIFETVELANKIIQLENNINMGSNILITDNEKKVMFKIQNEGLANFTEDEMIIMNRLVEKRENLKLPLLIDG